MQNDWFLMREENLITRRKALGKWERTNYATNQNSTYVSYGTHFVRVG
jgi:hypothetical protein